MVVTILTVVTYTATKNKKATSPKTKTQQTVAKSIPPAAQQKTTTASVPATTTATKTIAATNQHSQKEDPTCSTRTCYYTKEKRKCYKTNS